MSARASPCTAIRRSIHAPTSTNILYSLLEPVVVEVKAPRGGAFHPKFWILRFVRGDDESENPPILRVLVLSRNLTFDRSWDICLTLEGSPGKRRLGVNREFGEFVVRLPEFARRKVPAERQEQAKRLGEEFRMVDWQLSPGFTEYRFHVLGLKRKSWRPPECRNMAIISPFCDGAVLKELSRRSKNKTSLISRPEELEQLPPELLSNVECFFLDEAAETEDGEETANRESVDQPLVRSVGLHAKAYLCERGWYSQVIVGSANATTAALTRASNVELLVEMEGKTSAVGSIDELLSPERFGGLLHRFVPSEEPVLEDPERIARREAEANLFHFSRVPPTGRSSAPRREDQRAFRRIQTVPVRAELTRSFSDHEAQGLARDSPPLSGGRCVRFTRLGTDSTTCESALLHVRLPRL